MKTSTKQKCGQIPNFQTIDELPMTIQKYE